MITGATTLSELERIAREHHVISILFERPPNNRSGVAARVERTDRVVVVRTGATVADALQAALAAVIATPFAPPNGCAICGLAQTSPTHTGAAIASHAFVPKVIP